MDNFQLDILLYAAAESMGQPELELYNGASDDFSVSNRFVRRMRRFINRVQRGERLEEWRGVINAAKRVVAVVLVICTVTLGGILSIEAVREVIYKYALEWRERRIVVATVGVPEEAELHEIETYREPRGIPKDFERYEGSKTKYIYSLEYEKITESAAILINYRQFVTDVGNKISVSNNGTAVSEVRIGKYDALCFAIEGGPVRVYTLVWNDGVYEYTIDGNVPLDELIKYAESIE